MIDNLIKMVERKRSSFMHEYLYNTDTGSLFAKELGFVPRDNSMFFKPSFAGRQVLLGVRNGKEVFSNRVWFDHGHRTEEEFKAIKDRLTIVEYKDQTGKE